MLSTGHHHGGASGGASATVDLLPFGVQTGWFAITLALTGLHLAEFVGTPRVRTAIHLAMAAGMAYMYLPGDAHPVPWTAIAVASAVGALAAATTARFVDAAHLAAMAYMFHAIGPATTAAFYALAVTYALAAVHAAWTAVTTPARVTGALMHASMAYMFLAMNPRGPHFVEQARSVGTEQWWWALAIGLLLLRVAADPDLWRNRIPARTLPR
jgi:hypothetical protein